MYIPSFLQEKAEQIRDLDVDQQEVPFDRDAWTKHINTVDSDGLNLGDIFDGLKNNVITRRDIFDRAPADPKKLDPCTSEDEARWIRFFILVMIWGYGDSDRRGPWRVKQMLHTPDFRKIICQAGKECYYGHFLKAYITLHSIDMLGPAYASKLLYFYCHNFNACIKPLIFDSLVVSALRSFDWPEWCVDYLATSEIPKQKNAKAYGQYLILMHNLAHNLGCSPDQLEYFLWSTK